MSLSDEELVISFRNGNASSCDELLSRHKSLVSALARPYFLIGGENEDLVQEGMIGLYKAITTFDVDKGNKFTSYAVTLVRQSIYDALKSANRDKHKPLNTFVSISDLNENATQSDSPEDIYISNEIYKSLISEISLLLSSGEKDVLNMYLEGFSYQEMAKNLGKDAKYIDNVLQRIKRKIRKIRKTNR
ncbi:MAG: sigma-70 family RNA polymerase sigma factor [Clostridia bacterium]|jgi:RNA polymerase sporulation-specific sigma factor|nr:sigma-70 family RNA polymerase sigma factor [Clostridia bacterium]MCX4367276.1 sigma-70 family RNA polymerase sigma factor [Clostridia bacterium]